MIPHPPSIATFGVLLAASFSPTAPVALQPGEYQVTAVSIISNEPKGKPDSASRCLTATELANPEAVFNNRFMAHFKPDATCTIKNLDLTPSHVRYSTDCKYSTVDVTGTLTATSYSVVRKAKPKGGSGPEVETKLDGKRVGSCRG